MDVSPKQKNMSGSYLLEKYTPLIDGTLAPIGVNPGVMEAEVSLQEGAFKMVNPEKCLAHNRHSKYLFKMPS